MKGKDVFLTVDIFPFFPFLTCARWVRCNVVLHEVFSKLKLESHRTQTWVRFFWLEEDLGLLPSSSSKSLLRLTVCFIVFAASMKLGFVWFIK